MCQNPDPDISVFCRAGDLRYRAEWQGLHEVVQSLLVAERAVKDLAANRPCNLHSLRILGTSFSQSGTLGALQQALARQTRLTELIMGSPVFGCPGIFIDDLHAQLLYLLRHLPSLERLETGFSASHVRLLDHAPDMSTQCIVRPSGCASDHLPDQKHHHPSPPSPRALPRICTSTGPPVPPAVLFRLAVS
jgi:hypothetical protein